MMKCNQCGATLLMEQIPEVHISEVKIPCNKPECGGVCTYINNPSVKVEKFTLSGDDTSGVSVLMEDDPGAHHG